MNDAYRAINMLLEHLRKLDAPTVTKLQIETQLIRIKRLLVAPCSHEVQESVLPVILKLIANLQQTYGSSGRYQHLEDVVSLVHQLAEKALKSVCDDDCECKH
jgi:hypothetical protein